LTVPIDRPASIDDARAYDWSLAPTPRRGGSLGGRARRHRSLRMGDAMATAGTRRANDTELPTDPVCAGCGTALSEPYGYCSNCRAAFCFACERAHYCQPGCAAAGCLAGLCVRQVKEGVLSSTWGLPSP
jgi:hypothetical protein